MQVLVDGALVTLTPEQEAAYLAEVSPPPTNDSLTAYAAHRRWQKETAGIAFNGIPVATDDRSKQMILGARVAADADSNFTTSWVGTDGSIYPLNAATVIAISNAVLAHVSACFAIYAAVKTAIDAGTTTTFDEIDAAFG